MNRFGLAALLTAGALSVWWQAPSAAHMSDDAYQYIDAAAEISSGECLCTRLAHFDEQLETGHFPVAFTHFPPGYPLLIAAVSRVGISLEKAAYALSVAGYLFTLWMFWSIAQGLGSLGWISFAFGLLWVTHATALNTATKVATEAPFTAVLLVLIALIVRDIRTKGSHPGLLLAVGLSAGTAYWLRYAGLFLIPVAGLYIVWRTWQSRKVSWAAGALALLAGLMLAIQIRNIHYTGSWRGGFSAGQSHRLSWVLVETAKAFYHVVFGDRAVARADVWSVLFLISAGILLWLSYQYRRDFQHSRLASSAAWIWLGAISAVYIAGVMAVALTSIAADFTRYYLPLYPLALAALSAALSRFPATIWRTAGVVGSVVAVLVIQGRSLAAEPSTSPHVQVTRALDQPITTGGTGLEWLLAHTQPQDTIVSVNGQALHYVLQRPVISIIGPQFSAHPANEPVLHDLMNKFHARYLVVFPGMVENAQEQADIPFLAGLASGAAPPEWLANAARGNAVSVWECQECVR